ncbi:OmpA family protein [Cytophagales bacterium LB-30]|uniref:OmpA family protein n=1 Tax=Shiella aurantiaca TaxID=3058365 RepID=A0ABT8F6V2_9BACT|nr:OmpA family protein [Shiella aurantiaca]MDN4166099.1 OmpA family protein [Shiella aurantiaca]
MKYYSPILCLGILTSLASLTYAQEKTKIEALSTPTHVEFSPTISADGKTIIFETDKGDGWELYESQMDDAGNWGTPVPLTAINEKCDFLAGPNISYDGNLLYYTAFIEDVTESEDIFYSRRIEGGGWSEPIRLPETINTDDYEAFPSISADENSLYFIRINHRNPIDKKTEENCFTIYVSQKQADDTWGEAVPLPPVINSGCERDPKIMADNRTLIFSSIRPDGLGKFDMYQTRLGEDGTWEEPRALSFINSAGNDQSPCIAASGDVMYYYSEDDIWSVSIPEEFRQLINVTISGAIVDAVSQSPVAAKLIITDLDNPENVSQLDNNAEDGRYNLVLGAKKRFKVEIQSANYLYQQLDFDFSTIETYKEIKQNIELESRYMAQIELEDLELKKPLSGWLRINKADGSVVWEDSLHSGQPAEITLSSLEKYTAQLRKEGYEARDTSLVFDPQIYKATTPLRLKILKEKVVMSVNVNDMSSNKKMRSKVYFKNLDEDETIVAESGESVSLRRGDRYEVLTSSDKGYAFASTTLVAGEGVVNEDGSISNEIQLSVARIEEGSMLTLKSIEFASNSATLDSASYFELSRVIELLKNNKKVVVEVAAHTDDVGDDGYNLHLSENRAQSVVNYLLSQGIPVSQIVPKGYGETQPLVENTSEENRAKNRRVELKVLSSK